MNNKLLSSTTVSDVIGTVNPPSNSELFKGDINTSLAKLISTGIRLFFFVAALAALTYLLLGAFAWITSSGDKENLKKAQDKIQSAVVGLLILVVVLVVVATLEEFILPGAFCIGLTCNINIPHL